MSKICKPDGIDLILFDYCAFCPDFETDIEKIDVTTFGDKTRRVTTSIRCRNASKCERLLERLDKCKENQDGTK